MGLGIPPLTIQILLESNPLKSRILVRRLAVPWTAEGVAMGMIIIPARIVDVFLLSLELSPLLRQEILTTLLYQEIL